MTIQARPPEHCPNSDHEAAITGSLLHLFCGLCRGYIITYVFPANEMDAILDDFDTAGKRYRAK